jgi:hypothetical protein
MFARLSNQNFAIAVVTAFAIVVVGIALVLSATGAFSAMNSIPAGF